MKTKNNFCTLFDKKFLIGGLTLYYSLLKHNKGDFNYFVLCMDNEVYNILEKMNLKYITLIKLKDIETESLLKIKAGRNTPEYSWTLKPFLLEYIFDNFKDIKELLYLDGDLYFYSSPDAIFKELGSGSVLLTPHNIPEAKKQQELNYGKYNAGMILFKNDSSGRKCLKWWKEKCYEWCFDDIEPTRQGDQKYLNYFQEKFSGVVISKNNGINLAPWNMKKNINDLKKNCNEIFVGKNKLVFFHFSRFKYYYPPSLFSSNGPLDYYFEPSFQKKLIYNEYLNSLYATIKKIKLIFPDFEISGLERPIFYKQMIDIDVPIIFRKFKKIIKFILAKLKNHDKKS